MRVSLTLSGASTWTKILLLVSLGKAFVAGAGLGLAMLGVVDIASTLGLRPIMDLIQREHVMEIFAVGGGTLSVIGQIASLTWKFFSR